MEIRPVRKAWRNEVHVVNEWNGHVPDIDCWCEPKGQWTKNTHGVLIFVIQHNDITTSQHKSVLNQRTLFPDVATRILDSVYMFEHER